MGIEPSLAGPTERAQGEALLRFEPKAVAAPALPPMAPPPVAPPDAGPAPRSRQRTIGWIAVFVGGASLAVGGVTYGIALDKSGDLDAVCKDTCPRDQDDELASYNAFRTTSIVTLVGGAVVTGAGALLVLTAPSAPPRVEARLRLGATGASAPTVAQHSKVTPGTTRWGVVRR